jgi:hypothetical protein
VFRVILAQVIRAILAQVVRAILAQVIRVIADIREFQVILALDLQDIQVLFPVVQVIRVSRATQA